MRILLLTLFINVLTVFSTTYYVNDDAAGANNGLTWNDAYTSFQDALDIATSGDEIWVAAGTYKPSYDYGLGGGSRFFHFRMINGVSIYGGFAGTESAVSERTDFGEGGANETILSGDLNSNNTADNSDVYHIFLHPTGSTLTNSAILDGFTLEYAKPTGGSCSHGTTGGAICLAGSNLSPVLRNLTSTGHSGGGSIYVFQGSATIESSTFHSNTDGSGISLVGSGSSTVTDCIFRDNVSFGGGAGLAVTSGAFLYLINSLLYDNHASVGGGGIAFVFGGNGELTNCTFYSNTAGNDGGAVGAAGVNLVINNSIFYENFPQFQCADNGSITLNHSIYDANPAENDIEAGSSFNATNNNLTGDPLFVNEASDDYRLSFDSPCIDAGDNTYISETYDIRGEDYSRKLGKLTATAGTIDMGAYEFRAGYDGAIISLSVGSILGESAVGNVNLLADSVPSITSKGVVWNTSPTPTTSLTTKTNAGTGSSNFSSDLTNLIPGTIYYARAYIINSEGTTYSEEVAFETQTYEIPIDGNQDKVKDEEQDYITTILSSNSVNYISVVAPSSGTITEVSNRQQTDDQQFVYPFGITEFKINASQAEVKIYYHGIASLDGYTYRKLLPNDTYGQFDNVTFSTEIINGNEVAVATLNLVDGGAGDYDGIVNGVIYDPGGPSLPVSANIPYWDWWWVLVLVPIIVYSYKKLS